ncbi:MULTISPECIES: hypothetical protein [unclassified Rhizobium]|uniref:hypothetical protein n=1 Tax=unclassified Rhizobium TaxID=2613769 RepID=UPI002B24A85D|nr:MULTISPECIES: hypothetical protein [unclassified Rhizobium]
MDFLSIILAALGIQRERASKASDRKIDAYRLISEVAVEAAQAGNMVAMAMPGIMLWLQALYPDQPELHASCSNTLTTMLEQSRQLYHMAENYKPTIENGSSLGRLRAGVEEAARVEIYGIHVAPTYGGDHQAV